MGMGFGDCRQEPGLPEEHMIECVCELLHSIGYTMDGSGTGKMLMDQFSARLRDLKRCEGSAGRGAFSKRIQFQIQDLLDLRAKSWEKKLFKEQAVTKEECRKAAQKEARKGFGPRQCSRKRRGRRRSAGPHL